MLILSNTRCLPPHLDHEETNSMYPLCRHTGVLLLSAICAIFPSPSGKAEMPLSDSSVPSESVLSESVLSESVQRRGDLRRSREAFLAGRGVVAFLGGSITEMNGYRPMVMESLSKRYPASEFLFVNAGIASTCSHTGAFRLRRDVLSAKPDLLLVEFAVNDDQDAAHDYKDAVRGMEGIIRAARTERPEMDIVMVHFVNPGILEAIDEGKLPTSISAHETVAKHYSIPTCNVAVELAKRIESGSMTWKKYGGVHPAAAGNRVAADLVDQVFDWAWGRPGRERDVRGDQAVRSAKERVLPEPIEPSCFSRGRFLSPDQIELGEGWQRSQPQWSELPGSFRKRFAGRDLTWSDKPGASLELSFSGTAIGLYVLAGPDAGAVEFSIDDGPWQRKDLYHRYSKGLHYPRTVVLDSGLPGGEHRVRLRVADESHEQSAGTAVRVLQFAAS
jgi:lysophospholipase L1-like esterase